MQQGRGEGPGGLFCLLQIQCKVAAQNTVNRHSTNTEYTQCMSECTIPVREPTRKSGIRTMSRSGGGGLGGGVKRRRS